MSFSPKQNHRKNKTLTGTGACRARGGPLREFRLFAIFRFPHRWRACEKHEKHTTYLPVLTQRVRGGVLGCPAGT